MTADLRPRQGHEVLVRTLYSGISRGTESLVYRGEVPPSEAETMRAPFQEGAFPGPVKYGYQSVGVVEEGPDEIRGRTVFCLYPHQDLYVVPVEAVAVLPDGLPAERAVLAANLETAVNVVWDARPTVGDRVVVVGAGVIGLLTAWLCRRIPGTEVVIVDPNSSRSSVAGALDLEWREAIGDLEGGAADVVVHASGQGQGLVDALRVAGSEALVLEASWYGTRPVTLPLGEAFHSRRLTIVGSQVGRVPLGRRARWSPRRRLALALRLLSSDALDCLITGESAFEELPAVMERLSRDPGSELCHRVRYETAA